MAQYDSNILLLFCASLEKKSTIWYFAAAGGGFVCEEEQNPSLRVCADISRLLQRKRSIPSRTGALTAEGGWGGLKDVAGERLGERCQC